MRELLDVIDKWRQAGQRVALARVVGLDGSGPRDPGAAMAVNESGEVAGSVSGGCVEGAVVTEALAVLAGDAATRRRDVRVLRRRRVRGRPHLRRDDPRVRRAPRLVSAPTPVFDALRDALRTDEPVALATVTDGVGVGAKLLVGPARRAAGTLGTTDLDRVVGRDALGALAAGTTVTRHYGPHGEARETDVTVFIESFAPPPRMIIFGAVDFTAALARTAKLLGYHVTVCDARAVFATAARFPMADEVVCAWPDRYLAEQASELTSRDAVCVLTHDAKFDVPAILAALAPTSATSGRWAAAGRTTSGSRGSRRPASTPRAWRGCTPRSASTSAPGAPRRPRSPSAPRSSPGGPAGPHRRCATATGPSIDEPDGERETLTWTSD